MTMEFELSENIFQDLQYSLTWFNMLNGGEAKEVL
jgi:hypothetical protein